MLVFTRRLGEAIMIGDGVEIRVLRVGRDGVKIGVVAPTATPVHRHEVYQQIVESNRAAATADTRDPDRRAALEALLPPQLP